EMEYGVGIHGEPGIQREKTLSADELAKRMTEALVRDLQIQNQKGAEVALLMNGFGATPLQELYVLTQSVARELDGFGISVAKTLVGNYMTSIDMAGASVSILLLDDELKQLLAETCDTPALKLSGVLERCNFQEGVRATGQGSADQKAELSAAAGMIQNNQLTTENVIFAIDRMSDCIIENEVPFCELDSHAGDGDFGMSVAKGFRQLQREWNDLLSNHSQSIGEFLEACSLIIMEHCGGASGPIWGSAFRAAGKYAGTRTSLSLAELAEMMQAAVVGIQKTGERSFGRGAGIGDKTLMDALIPCADSLTADAVAGKSLIEAFHNGANAAKAGAESTKAIVARMGRAGTVGERSLGYPDAGAHALGVIFETLANSFS
ncbi:MAG: DAK2 domain-containing protein, partial [Bacteroidia bacterium]|nr:DAK2 domain-containing protein [Bacteroidia bacterium]